MPGPGGGAPGSGLLQAPLADRLREGEHRARERGAVLQRAHHGVRDQHFDAARAHVLGARGVLVRTGYGEREEGKPPNGMKADAIVDNLVAASSWILNNL